MRLILSTFRDGGGQNKAKGSPPTSMPGFRDFERAVAAVCDGEAREDKGVFDVLVLDPDGGRPFGISCKMSALQPAGKESSFMELANSAAAWNAEFSRLQLSWVHSPTMAGTAVIDLVAGWHDVLADQVDVGRSVYLVLAHDRRWATFQLHAFPLSLNVVDPATQVSWEVNSQGSVPKSIYGYIDIGGRRHCLWQLYPNSGGQLKYFPPLSWATFRSPPFTLELPPAESLRDRAREYWPELWAAATP